MKNKRLELINSAAAQYNEAKSSEFNEICKPLKLLGVSWFGYTKMFHDGRYLLLNNDLKFSENFFSNIQNVGQYCAKEFQNSPSDKIRGFFVPNDINLYHSKRDLDINMFFEHNIWNLYSLIHSVNDQYIQLYTFGMKKDQRDAENYYANHNHLLLKFVDYFQDAAENMMSDGDGSHFGHVEQSFDFHQKSIESLTTAKVSQFLQSINVDKKLIQGKHGLVKLAKREIECLDYLALGYGMKGVASMLDLSPRTVELYINNAKLKTGYSNKQLLLTQFIKDFKNYSV